MQLYFWRMRFITGRDGYEKKKKDLNYYIGTNLYKDRLRPINIRANNGAMYIII
jgi:hypothetical protein